MDSEWYASSGFRRRFRPDTTNRQGHYELWKWKDRLIGGVDWTIYFTRSQPARLITTAKDY